MTIQSFFLLFFPACMVMAALYDISTFKIPNWISLALITGFIFIVFISGMTWSEIWAHLSVGIAILLLGFVLFASGIIGAGDAKLLASSALWIGWPALLPYVIWVTLSGAILAVVILLFRKLPISQKILEHPWIERLHNAQSGIPYGAALGVGGLIVFTQTSIFSMLVV